jgi:uncharacterized protein (TIGR02145 family)
MKKFLMMFCATLFCATVFNGCSKEDEKDSTLSKSTALFNPSVNYGTMTDQEGNVYKTVTLGTQTWMAENLKTIRYNDGKTIPLVTDRTAWSNLSTGAYCNNNNTLNSDSIDTFGRLYNWYAINTGKLAPNGWHVPTLVEYQTLVTYLGGGIVAAGKLKETGLTHWMSPNTASTNESGFTALPGGERNPDGWFDFSEYSLGGFGWWWCTTANGDYANFIALSSNFSYIWIGDACYKKYGYSVRCVKD